MQILSFTFEGNLEFSVKDVQYVQKYHPCIILSFEMQIECRLSSDRMWQKIWVWLQHRPNIRLNVHMVHSCIQLQHSSRKELCSLKRTKKKLNYSQISMKKQQICAEINPNIPQ